MLSSYYFEETVSDIFATKIQRIEILIYGKIFSRRNNLSYEMVKYENI